jgi:uncharacterized membrane protein required for colicin V production
MSLSLIDILFLITVALLVFNGLRNGAIFSLVNLLGIPIGFFVASTYGPRFLALLAANGLPATLLIAYIVLFFGTVLVLHIIGTLIHNVVRRVPFVNLGDSLLGGLIGLVEAWLIWLILLIVLGNFLNGVQTTVHAAQQTISILPGATISFDQLKSWHDFYNQAVSHSLFAQVNSVFVKQLPSLPQPPQ